MSTPMPQGFLTIDQIAAALKNPNVKAFLRVIREGESSQDDDKAYRMRYPGVGKPPAFFDDFSKHPKILEVTPTGKRSSAAGAYQITGDTYDWLVSKYGFTDFSPATQDVMAVCLIQRRGALEAVEDGDLAKAVRLCGNEWASLPDSELVDGGSKKSWATAEAVFEHWGGVFRPTTAGTEVAEIPAPAPIVDLSEPELPEVTKENEMPAPVPMPKPLLIGVAQTLGQAIPEFAKLFLDPSKSVPERNIEAASLAIDKITTAIRPENVPAEAWNAQAAAQAVAASPAVASQARAALLGDYERLLGMVTKAQEADDVSKDRAQVRAQKERWDMLPFLADKAFRLIASALIIEVGLLMVGFLAHVSNEALMILLTLLVGTLNKLADRWGQLYDYRIGSSEGSKASGDAVRELAQQSRRP